MQSSFPGYCCCSQSDYGRFQEQKRLLLHPDNVSEVCFFIHAPSVVVAHDASAVYPRTYDPSYAISCCLIAVIFASAFALIFPLLAPAVLVLLFLTLVGELPLLHSSVRPFRCPNKFTAHRFLIGYVYGRTHSSTGGLLQIWLLHRLATILAFQPFVMGLIFLTRRIWVEGGILVGAAVLVIVITEAFCHWRTRLPGRSSLSPITQDSLRTFEESAKPGIGRDVDEESTSLVSSARNTRARGSFASVLEMMSLLAVTPSPSETRGPVPLGQWCFPLQYDKTLTTCNDRNRDLG